MKGKKTDSIFVSQFIQESVKEGIESSDDIVNRAKKMISDIDKKIKAAELSKKMRPKLLDVIAAFENSKKEKLNESKLLPFFELKHPDICRKICNMLYYDITISGELKSFDLDTRFVIKQLLEAKILKRVGDEILNGERFQEYMQFVFQEDK